MPDRRPETVTSWLQKYPAIQMVSRDGFTGFRQGITEANPSIKQIYDRWHFITKARKQLDSTLSSIVPSTILWEETTPISADTFPETRAEQRKRKRKETKWELIKEIQKEHNHGKNISRLSREYNLDRRTIQKYLKMKEPPSGKRTRKKATDLYKKQMEQLELKGNTVKEIYSILQKSGYKGSYSGVRVVVESLRKERKHSLGQLNSIRFSRRNLSTWIWKYSEQLIQKKQLIYTIL